MISSKDNFLNKKMMSNQAQNMITKEISKGIFLHK